MSKSPPARRGRPKKLVPTDWIPLADVHGLLHLYSSTQEAIENICEQLHLAPKLGQRIVDTVRNSGSVFGFEQRGVRPLTFPEFPRKDAERRWAQELERRLQRAFALNPQVALTGALIHLEHFNPSKRDVVFKGPNQNDKLTKYLRLLRLMEIEIKDIQILLRKTGESDLPAWAKKPLEAFGAISVRCIAPPVPAKASSYRDWVGIKLLDDSGWVWAGVTRGLMFFAFIVISSRVLNPVEL